MCEARHDDVLKGGGLVLRCLDEGGVAVAEQVHPPTAHAVQYAAAIVEFQPDAFGTAYRQQWQRLVVLHLGAGVPYGGQVTTHKVGTEFSSGQVTKAWFIHRVTPCG